jgi:YebC/PmpR family DNA-binding regulatory protein
MIYNEVVMSGHSKWSKVKYQKAAKDPKRSKEFSKLSLLIMNAVRDTGNPDPNQNPTLRKLVEDARAANMGKDKIEKAIKKGAGIGEEGALESITLEGYGPGGVAIMIKAQTDNRNRTISEIRHFFKEYGGSLGEPGSAAYVFGNDPANPVFRTPVDGVSVRGMLEELIAELEEYADVDEVFNNLG